MMIERTARPFSLIIGSVRPLLSVIRSTSSPGVSRCSMRDLIVRGRFSRDTGSTVVTSAASSGKASVRWVAPATVTISAGPEPPCAMPIGAPAEVIRSIAWRICAGRPSCQRPSLAGLR